MYAEIKCKIFSCPSSSILVIVMTHCVGFKVFQPSRPNPNLATDGGDAHGGWWGGGHGDGHEVDKVVDEVADKVADMVMKILTRTI